MPFVKEPHLSDEQLLLSVDGELSFKRSLGVRAHLMACWECRARMAKTEETIVDFVRAHRESLDPMLQPIEGPQALLRARLAELAKDSRPGWLEQLRAGLGSRVLKSAVAFALLFVVIGMSFLYLHMRSQFSVYAAPLPNPNLTPGATRPATLGDLCASPREDVIRRVPAQVREAVFREYGISGAPAKNYEIDHLVTPGLGGSDDMKNLWPEPHNDTEWNSYVKDQLEDHLHHLVCTGQVSLDMAQHDMESNWISAYEKYFHTDRPLLPYTSAGAPANPGRSSPSAFSPISAEVWLSWSLAALCLLAAICYVSFQQLETRNNFGDASRFQISIRGLRAGLFYLSISRLIALPKTPRPARV